MSVYWLLLISWIEQRILNDGNKCIFCVAFCLETSDHGILNSAIMSGLSYANTPSNHILIPHHNMSWIGIEWRGGRHFKRFISAWDQISFMLWESHLFYYIKNNFVWKRMEFWQSKTFETFSMFKSSIVGVFLNVNLMFFLWISWNCRMEYTKINVRK